MILLFSGIIAKGPKHHGPAYGTKGSKLIHYLFIYFICYFYLSELSIETNKRQKENVNTNFCDRVVAKGALVLQVGSHYPIRHVNVI